MLLLAFRSNFQLDFKGDLGSIKRHLASLKDETTLAHRSQVHSLVMATQNALPGTNANKNDLYTVRMPSY